MFRLCGESTSFHEKWRKMKTKLLWSCKISRSPLQKGLNCELQSKRKAESRSCGIHLHARWVCQGSRNPQRISFVRFIRHHHQYTFPVGACDLLIKPSKLEGPKEKKCENICQNYCSGDWRGLLRDYDTWMSEERGRSGWFNRMSIKSITMYR